MLLYIGPGLSAGAIILIIVVLLIVLFSFGMILWIPIKKMIRKIFKKD